MKQLVWIVSIYKFHNEGQTVIDSIWSSEEMALARFTRLLEASPKSSGWRPSCDEHEVDPEVLLVHEEAR